MGEANETMEVQGNSGVDIRDHNFEDAVVLQVKYKLLPFQLSSYDIVPHLGTECAFRATVPALNL